MLLHLVTYEGWIFGEFTTPEKAEKFAADLNWFDRTDKFIVEILNSEKTISNEEIK